MVRKTSWGLLLFLIFPVLVNATSSWSQGWPSSWRTAEWASSGIAPNPKTAREAIIQVYAARSGRWKGAVAVHTWIIMKPANARRFERYEVVGWGRPVRRNGYAVDGYWYSNKPGVVHEIRGDLAARLIPKIRADIARYPSNRRGDYRVWPGPNSNTFIAWIARRTPELGLEMPATAVGKDFLGRGFETARTPSATGWQFAIGGVFGVALALREGLEVHILGVTLGLDPEELAIKLPGIGKVGLLLR